MSGLVTLDDNIIEFNNPRLGIDVPGLQKWAQEVKETALKTALVAKVVIELRMTKWITPEVSESQRVEDGKTITRRNVTTHRQALSETEIELDKEDNENFEKYDFEEAAEEVKNFLDNATSYGVVFTLKAYQSNDTLVGSISRKFGRIDKRDLKVAHEAVNKPITLPPMTINVGGRPRTIPARPILRPMPPVNPEAEFEKLFDSLEKR